MKKAVLCLAMVIVAARGVAAAAARCTSSSSPGILLLILQLHMPTKNSNVMCARRLQSSSSSLMVACNVYVSAGGNASGHGPVLTKLLHRAQDMLRHGSDEPLLQLQQQQPSSKIEGADAPLLIQREPGLVYAPPVPAPTVGVLVHAYVDPAYNRSSFHLAGTAELVARVATDMAVTAVTDLRTLQQEQKQNSINSTDDAEAVSSARNTAPASATVAHHPYIGLVDHVSFMPLQSVADQKTNNNNEEGIGEYDLGTTPAGEAARQVGQAMKEQLGIHVLFYGAADHPNQRTLADVRKHETKFFRSGGLSNDNDAAVAAPRQQESFAHSSTEAATVGAPEEFVENYNIRLRGKRNRAQQLTRLVRERDGGLKFVEALTLPYSDGRWEVARNLLRPGSSTNASDIQAVVDAFEISEAKSIANAEETVLVEKCYRVGTTAEECLQALQQVSRSVEHRRSHDEAVAKRFQTYFGEPVK